MDYEGERKRIMREYKRIVRESQWILEKVDAEYSLDATVFRIARVWSMGKGRQVSVVSAHRKAMIRFIKVCRMAIPKIPCHPC